MNLRELLQTVMEQYPTESTKNYTNNKLANTIRHGLEESLGKDFLPSTMNFKGSAGISKWAKVPWMGVFDGEIATGPSAGVGVVYLFSYSAEYVYLSLDQSWTFYQDKYKKNAPEKIRQVSRHLQSELTTISPQMSIKPIDLIEESKISKYPRGYELGNIVSIKYSKNNLPNEDVLLDDLRQMIKVLEELKIKLSKVSDDYRLDDFIN